MKHIRLVVAATALICASAAQAYVTQGAVTLEAQGSVTDGIDGYDLHFGTSSVNVQFTYDGNQTHFVTASFDPLFQLLTAQPGDVINMDTAIPRGDDPASLWANSLLGGLDQTVGHDFYIAGAVVPFRHLFEPPTEQFGWAHLVADASGTLTVVESAITYGEQGIIVGTTQAVPEPSSLALMLLGLGFAGLHARRKTMSRN